MPAVQDPVHSVNQAEVAMQPVTIDTLPPVELQQSVAPNPNPFGHPRSIAVKAVKPTDFTPPPAEPTPAVRNPERIMPTVEMAKPPVVHGQQSSHAVKIAQRTSGHLIAPKHDKIEPTSYPANLGYSYGGPSDMVKAGGFSQTQVHGKLLRQP